MNFSNEKFRKKQKFKYFIRLTLIDSCILCVILLSLTGFINSRSISEKDVTIGYEKNFSLTAGISAELSKNFNIYNSSVANITPVKKNVVKQNIIHEEQRQELENQYSSYVDRHFPIDYSNNEEIYQEYIYPLAKIIYAEGRGMSDEFQKNVGYVVFNRIDSKYYPNTLNEVFFSNDSYAEASRKSFLNEKVSEQALENAKIVVNEYFNGSIPVCPAMVFQAEFKQGVDIFKIGNTYFGCDQRIHNDME